MVRWLDVVELGYRQDKVTGEVSGVRVLITDWKDDVEGGCWTGPRIR